MDVKMRLASFDIFDTTLIRLFGRPENINVLLAGKEHTKGDALEREVEKVCLVANPEVRDIIRKRREEGWQIAFISDMYLDSVFLTEILKREGCYEEGDKVYISCEHNARKDTGELYDVVRKGLQPAKWEHYGDNVNSDIRMAEQKGITAHYVDNRYRDLASRHVVAAYVPYIIWVINEAKRQNISRLYFISRDGYILQKIAEALPHDGLELRYFFTSRKALKNGNDNGNGNGNGNGNDNGNDNGNLTEQYFRQEGLFEDRKSAMVDVGWLGTSRKMINTIIKDNGGEAVHFFYFGTRRDIMDEGCGTYQSYLEAGLLPYYMQLLVEHYFSASPYPTTLGYAIEDPSQPPPRGGDVNYRINKVVPVFPDGEAYRETKITQTNVDVCQQMVEAFKKVRFPSDEVLSEWAHMSLDILANQFTFTDFSPLTDLPKFDGQDFVRRLTIKEMLLMMLTGQHITVFDKGSLAITFSNIRIQKMVWSLHCKSGKVRSWMYQRIK